MDPRQQIRDYVDHLEDTAYVRAVFAAAGVSGVAGLLVAMLRGGDRDAALAAGLFLRDAVLFGMAPDFALALPRTGVFPALRANLYVPDYAVRRDSVYTIGKLTVRTTAGLLREAFPVALRRDPLLLPRLLSELSWLTGGKRPWAYLRRVAESPHYLVRWSLLAQNVSLVGDFGRRRGPEGRKLRRLYGRLAADPHPLVRAEARHRRAALVTRREERLWRNGGWERVWKRLSHGEPDRSFSSLELLFGNCMTLAGWADYDLADLDAFVGYWQAHPVPRPDPDDPDASPFDLQAYAAGFAAGRRGGG
jgi:hypothetical protein